MKKIFLALAILSTTLVSCEKEVEMRDCNCGIIQDTIIDSPITPIEIKNNCSGNLGYYSISEIMMYEGFPRPVYGQGVEVCWKVAW